MQEQNLLALWSAEQQLLNAAGAARVAGRRVSGAEEALDLTRMILDAAQTLEDAAGRIRELRRTVLAPSPAVATPIRREPTTRTNGADHGAPRQVP